MNGDEEAAFWAQMDEGFRAAVEADKNVAAHAHIGRAALEQHLRTAHGILAHTKIRDAGAAITVTELSAETEAKLRVSHWRAHELGLEHRQ